MAAYPHKIDPQKVIEDAKARFYQKQVKAWPGGEIRIIPDFPADTISALEALVDAINEANHHEQ